MSTHTIALTHVQEMHFDVCDLLNGCSYSSLGYDNRTDCLTTMRDKLLMVEQYIEQQIGDEE
jgi:hypothetical protein